MKGDPMNRNEITKYARQRAYERRVKGLPDTNVSFDSLQNYLKEHNIPYKGKINGSDEIIYQRELTKALAERPKK